MTEMDPRWRWCWSRACRPWPRPTTRRRRRSAASIILDMTQAVGASRATRRSTSRCASDGPPPAEPPLERRGPARRQRALRQHDGHHPARLPARAASSSSRRRVPAAAADVALASPGAPRHGHQERRRDRLRAHGLRHRAGGGAGRLLRCSFVEANDELVKRGLGRLRETLDGLVGHGQARREGQGRDAGAASPARRGSRISRRATSSIEAMTENQALKNETFAKLDGICPPARAARHRTPRRAT